jgi:hypothetical protein
MDPSVSRASSDPPAAPAGRAWPLPAHALRDAAAFLLLLALALSPIVLRLWLLLR